jgi:hypothetical protein
MVTWPRRRWISGQSHKEEAVDRRRRRWTATRRHSICSPRKMIGPAAARRRVDPCRPRHDGQPRLRRKRRPRWRPQLLQDGSTGGDRNSGVTGAARPGAATNGRRTAATGGAWIRYGQIRADEEGRDRGGAE